MNKMTALIGLMLVFVLVLTASPASAIIGGEIDTEHTNVGAIMMVWPQFDGIIGRLCSGTLIHERALLTAAHCTSYIVNQGIGYDQVWVTFDQDPFDNNAQYLDVEDIIVHPDFGAGQGSYDIALVILAEPVVGVAPEPLPEVGYMDNILKTLNGKNRRGLGLIIVGYGCSQILAPPEVLLDAIRRNGTVSFEKMLPFVIKSSQNSDLGDSQISPGDSGGPLFHIDRQGNEVLVGLRGNDLGGSVWDGPTMFHYRVDTNIARDFIDTNLPQD